MKHRGFTMVELVVVIVVVGILAAIAIPRLVDRQSFDSRAFYDRAQSVVRHAQKVAIARRASAAPIYVCVAANAISAETNSTRRASAAPIYVCVAANAISAGTNSTCSTLLPDPSGNGTMTFAAPTGVTLSPTGNFFFDGLGQPSAARTITLTSTIPGDPARVITVAALTGYVQHNP